MRKIAISLCLVLAILGVVYPSVPLTAQTSQATDPLLGMLALVPDSKEISPEVYYFDFRAAEAVMGVSPVKSADFATMDSATRGKWLNAVQRVAGFPDLFAYLNQIIPGIPKTTGIEWERVERTLYVGAPPQKALIFGGKFDPAQIGKVLESQDFTRSTLEGVTVWSRGEDGKVDVKKRDPGNPFGGRLGQSARIALLPGYVAGSPFTDVAKLIVGAHQGTQPSLAAKAEYRALAGAITDPKAYKGSLVQMVFWPVKYFAAGAAPTNRPANPQLGDSADYKALPAFSLMAFADRQEGAEQVNMMAVVYPDLATAERAAPELQQRLSTFGPKRIEAVRAKFDAPRLYQDDKKGPAVVVIAARYPLPEPPKEAGQPLTQPGLLLRLWLQAVMQREFYPLSVAVGP